MTNADDMEHSSDNIDFAAAVKKQDRRAGQRLSGRRVSDKKKLHSDDRRRLRATGRTEQLNLRVTAELKMELQAYARENDILPTEALEHAWAALKEKGGVR